MTSPSGRRPSSTEPAAAEEKNIRRDITPMPRRFVSVTVSSIVIASPRRQQIKISKIRCSLQPFFVTLPINRRTYSVSAKKKKCFFCFALNFSDAVPIVRNKNQKWTSSLIFYYLLSVYWHICFYCYTLIIISLRRWPQCVESALASP